jgi:hypothetical protein
MPRKPGGTRVGNAIRKARKAVKKVAKKIVSPVYKKKTTKSPLGGVKTVTKTYKNPLTGRKRKVKKVQTSYKTKKGKTRYSTLKKDVKVSRPLENTLTGRRTVKKKTKIRGVGTTKKTLKYSSPHIENTKTVTRKGLRRTKKKQGVGVPRTRRRSL